MSKGSAIVGMLVSLLAGYLLGGYMGGGGAGALAVVPAAAVPDPSVDRYKVPIGNAPVKGDKSAKVTIVQVSDFQCPFCSRVEPTVDQITRTYGKDVRVVWKNNPLPFHNNAMPAAEVAMAANADGKFWPMHDLLFKNQQALTRPDLEKYAAQVGVSASLVKDALDNNKYQAAIKADQDEAAKFGARGTPAFFINGRPLSGAQPFESFKKVIDEELANADKAIKAGVSPRTSTRPSLARPSWRSPRRPPLPAPPTTVRRRPPLRSRTPTRSTRSRSTARRRAARLRPR